MSPVCCVINSSSIGLMSRRHSIDLYLSGQSGRSLTCAPSPSHSQFVNRKPVSDEVQLHKSHDCCHSHMHYLLLHLKFTVSPFGASGSNIARDNFFLTNGCCKVKKIQNIKKKWKWVCGFRTILDRKLENQ